MTPRERATAAAVAADLRARIYADEFPLDERMPSRTEIAEQYRISPESASVALRMLAAGGLVELVQGRGTFVLKRRTYWAEAVVPRSRDGYEASADDLAIATAALEAAVSTEPAASGLETSYRHATDWPARLAAPALRVLVSASTGGPEATGLAQAVAVALAVVSTALRPVPGWDLSGTTVEARPADGDS